jgi:3-oxoacyl-[acyl-carrier protein] reductase
MIKIDLTHKTALVTGATGVLGCIMAQTLAECGADIVIHYHSNESKALELKGSIIEKYGVKAITVKADLTVNDEVLRLMDTVLSEIGKLDILVINAVSQYNWTTILEQSPEDYKSQYDACVMQSVYLIKAVVPQMIERNYGRVIGINTECAMQAYPTQSAYVAAKRGMDGVFRVLAKEVGQHQITVNQVAPGWTVTEKDQWVEPHLLQEYAARVPLNRRGTPQEIANAVAFLASDLAGFLTGIYLPVCGGNVMPGI